MVGIGCNGGDREDTGTGLCNGAEYVGIWQCTLCTVQCIMYNLYCILYTEHCILYICSVHYTIYIYHV